MKKQVISGILSATYQKDKAVFFMFADGVPYDECEKIVESIK